MRKEDKELGFAPGSKDRKAKLDEHSEGYDNPRDKADDGNTAQNGDTGGTPRGKAGYEERY